MIIPEATSNEQALIDSKDFAVPASSSPTLLLPAPPPYTPQPHSYTTLLPAQNDQTVSSQPPSPNARQRSASRRFFKAFCHALFIIVLIRMLVWSIGLVSDHRQREHRKWLIGFVTHKPHNVDRVHLTKPDRSGCSFGTGDPHCPSHSVPGPALRRIMPIRYPPTTSPDSGSEPNFQNLD